VNSEQNITLTHSGSKGHLVTLSSRRVTPSQIGTGHLLSSLESRGQTKTPRPKLLTSVLLLPRSSSFIEGHRVTPSKRWTPVHSNPGHLPSFSKPRGHPVAPGVENLEPVHLSSGHLPSLSKDRGHLVTPEFEDLTTVHFIPGHLPSFPGFRSLTETSRIRCHPPDKGHLPSIPEHICTCVNLGKQVTSLSLT
jgi:hypothetical protein